MAIAASSGESREIGVILCSSGCLSKYLLIDIPTTYFKSPHWRHVNLLTGKDVETVVTMVHGTWDKTNLGMFSDVLDTA